MQHQPNVFCSCMNAHDCKFNRCNMISLISQKQLLLTCWKPSVLCINLWESSIQLMRRPTFHSSIVNVGSQEHLPPLKHLLWKNCLIKCAGLPKLKMISSSTDLGTRTTLKFLVDYLHLYSSCTSGTVPAVSIDSAKTTFHSKISILYRNVIQYADSAIGQIILWRSRIPVTY